MIGATSLVKVTPAASFLFTINAAAINITGRTASKRFISSSSENQFVVPPLGGSVGRGSIP
jgi:hypothetical protein